MDYQRLFLDNLHLIDRIARIAGRRRHLSPPEQEDLSGVVRLRLIEDNYAVLRKFQNRSTFWTYLSSVIERISMDFCIEQWGRWRPSVMAEGLGPEAILLERLVHRDGYLVEEALELARTHHEVMLSEASLRDIWAQLPIRDRHTEVAEGAAAGVPARDTAEVDVEDSAHREAIQHLERALVDALERCTSQERLLLRLRFDQGLTMGEIAPILAVSVPTLQRRLSKVLGQLQAALKSSGVNSKDIPNLIGHQSIIISPLLRTELERVSGNVRLFKRDG